MELYPAIDIINGQCVRLTQGDYNQIITYQTSPSAQATKFENDGARWVHVVDLDAARTGKQINLSSIEAICANTQLLVQAGGGIRTVADATRLRDTGVSRVVLGTAGTENPDLVAEIADLMPTALSLDTRAGQVATHGWQHTSQKHFSELFKEFAQSELEAVILTDIASDGMLMGPTMGLYEESLKLLAKHNPALALIASGGIGEVDHIRHLAEMSSDKNTKLHGAIVGKALYEQAFSLSEALATAGNSIHYTQDSTP